MQENEKVTSEHQMNHHNEVIFGFTACKQADT